MISKSRMFLNQALNANTNECILWPFGTGGSKRTYGRWRCRHGAFSRYTHRQVCYEAHGEPPTPAHQAEHTCGNGLCVNPRHIRWATVAENNSRKKEHGTWGHTLDQNQVDAIRKRASEGEVQRRIAEDMNLDYATVNHVVKRRTWT